MKRQNYNSIGNQIPIPMAVLA